MRARRRLRLWLKKVAAGGASPNDVEDELQDLVDKYTEYMRIHRMKYRLGVVETLVTTSLQLVENLLRLKPKGALDAIIAFRTRKLALSEAELGAPGREVAYVCMAREELGE